MALHVAAAMLAAAMLAPAVGSAQDTAPPSSASPEAAAARALFQQATDELARGDFATARDHLRESLELFPRAATAYNLGLALESTGETVAAQETLAALLAGELGELPAARRAEVDAALARVRARIARIAIDAAGAPAIELRVDGRLHATLEDGGHAEVEVDAGHHVVLGSAEGHSSEERSVVLERGARETLRLVLEPLAAPIAAPPPSSGDALAEPWLWIVLGVLAAGGVAVGVVAATTDAFSVQPRTDPVFGRVEALRFALP